MFSLTYRQQLNDCVARQQWSQAVELCQRLLQDKEDAGTYALMAKALAYEGDCSEAITTYLKSLELQPHQPNSHYALGVLFERSEQFSYAMAHYQSALQLSPDWSQAALKLGHLFHRLGESSQALETYQSILKSYPNFVAAQLAIGALHEQTGRYSAAIRCYRQAIFTQPDNETAYRRLGKVLIALQAYNAAVDVYAQAIALCPSDGLLYNNLGQALAIQGENALAIAAYKKSLALSPKLASTYQNLGRLFRHCQSTKQATAYFQQACQLAPDNMSVLSDCTWQLIAEERWDQVLECFRLGCVSNPDFVRAYCQRMIDLPMDDPLLRSQRIAGHFLLKLLQCSEPIDERTLDSSQPEIKELLKQLGALYESLGALAVAGNAPRSAERNYRNALSLGPLSTHLYAALRDCLLQQGRSAAAVTVHQVGVQKQAADSTEEIVFGCDLSHLQQKKTGDDIRGVYRKTQDWLTDRTTQDLSPTVSIPTVQAERPDPNCGGLTCQRCMTKLVQKFSPTQVSRGAFACQPTGETDRISLLSFVAKIPRGRAWIAPQKDDWAVCNEIAVFSPDRFLLGDLSRYYPWYLPGCDRHDIKNHPVLRRKEPLPPVKQLPGKVAILSGLSGHVYYHWLFDVLPRFGILQQHIDLSNIDYFVVNGSQQAFQKETLQALNIPLEKVIASDQVPHLQAEELIVPSFAGYMDWVPPATIDFLRRTFLSLPASGSAFSIPTTDLPKGKRLYISRAQAKYRQVFNESEILALLERFGFESVALEQLGVAEQVQLFAQAEVIISPHGSGLSNLVFCSPGATVIELFSPYYLRTDYWMISEQLQLHHYYIIGESFAFHPLRRLMYPSGLTEDVLIDVLALRSLLIRIGISTV